MAKQESFPRATPYRAPDANHHPVSPAAPSSQRGMLLLMGGFCVLFLCAGLGIGLFFMKGNSPRQEPSDRNKEANANPVRERDQKLDDSLLAEREPLKDSTGPIKEIPRGETPVGGLQGGKMTSQPGTPPAIPVAVVEALGGLTTSHLYQTYLNVGLLADAVDGEVYDKDEARGLLDTVAGLTTELEQQLDRVSRQTVKADEKKTLEQARQVTASLRTQMRELRSYWEKGDKDHVTRYYQARQDAWEGMKPLLGIQE